MSGTSLDGLDLCLVELPADDYRRFKLLDYGVAPFPAALRALCLENMEPQSSRVDALTRLNTQLADWMGRSVLQMAEQRQWPEIDLIASHGQTLYHIPPDAETGATLQLGAGSWIAQLTGVTTAFNFRLADMAWGGQGAPLVPFLDRLLFSHPEKVRVLQNIGGMANLTYLAPQAELLAFDTGPGNALIDAWVQRKFQRAYDQNGDLAAQGQPCPELLQDWMQLPFFHTPPPRSTGRECFGAQFLSELEAEAERRELSDVDMLCSLTQLTAQSIVHAYTHYLPQRPDEVWLSGGGVHNRFLFQTLQALAPDLAFHSVQELGLNPDAKEALAFALLGLHCLLGRSSELQSVTGAQQAACLGELAPGRNWGALLQRLPLGDMNAK